MLVSDIDKARFNMVEQQVRPCEVIDERVLDTLRQLPREKFVPEPYQGLAFADMHIPLGEHSVMMKPVQEGSMLQALAIQPGDRVLEIGTGSGFTSACLQHLGGQVTSLEIDPELSAAAAQRLAQLGIRDIDFKVGDLFQSRFKPGSFDAIAVTGSLPMPNPRIERLLAPGGRLFVIEGEPPVMRASLIQRTQEGQFLREPLCETLLPALLNAPRPERFRF